MSFCFQGVNAIFKIVLSALDFIDFLLKATDFLTIDFLFGFSFFLSK
ncbi:hypothetical protein LNTAR_15007 [Lentisphaera araneosa HTCC2155]|uniref:Uncharacterized protein n=1 Tax=Lentisphaera araneosa HTCC2155 TaxID=313628 RepID=A6DHQ3_9BACT|nr:hypothetical protein LNTAR_15007 [Lentisphaera araneosa HTCC2155]